MNTRRRERFLLLTIGALGGAVLTLTLCRIPAARAGGGLGAVQFSGRGPNSFWAFDAETGGVWSCRLDGDRMCAKEGKIEKFGRPLARPSVEP